MQCDLYDFKSRELLATRLSLGFAPRMGDTLTLHLTVDGCLTQDFEMAGTIEECTTAGELTSIYLHKPKIRLVPRQRKTTEEE